jgi:myo-inositol 2-dehydrogenase/D-chiro-inositol 1-dehydrogenase/scyllo-inositol 2-dehydrogenase (NAD+)
MEEIGIALVGCGRAGMVHARNFAGRIRGARLVSLIDPERDAVSAAARELGVADFSTDVRDALKDSRVHALVVATPTVYHRDIVVAAAHAGRHVLCEKPMAMNVRECVDMMEAAERAKVKLQIAFMRRFDPGFLAGKEAVDSGRIGYAVLVKSLSRGPSTPQPWMFDLAKSNGTLAEVNSHDIDTLRWFTGSEFDEVYAIAGNYRCPQALPAHPDYYDNVVLTAIFNNGMQGIIDGAASVSYGYDARVEVLGTKGVLFIGRLEENSVLSCAEGQGLNQSVIRSWRHLFRDAYEAEDREFIECIRGDRPPKVGGRDGMMAVSVVNAGNESIRTKKPVKVVIPV